MRIKRARVENFRLLRDVEIGFEERTMLVVGRNNSGKTSVFEFFRRLLAERAPVFRLEDFSLGCHERFWAALKAFQAHHEPTDVLRQLPAIRLTLDFAYDTAAPDLGPLSECIIDLDPTCDVVRLEFSYAAQATGIQSLLAGYDKQRRRH